MKRSLRWAVTAFVVVVLVVFARSVDWATTWSAVRRASLPLILTAAALNLLSLAAKGVRWWLFLRPAGARSLGLALRATAAGAGLNNVLVANGGDAARVVFVARASGVPAASVLASLALERLFDAVGYVLLLAAAALVLPLPPELARWRVPAVLALLPLGGLLVFLARTSSRPASVAAEAALPERFLLRLRRQAGAFARSTATLSTGPRFAGALALSLAAWALQVATYAVAAAAAHAPLPLVGNVAAVLAVNLGLLLRATPGNVGFFQFVYALTAAPFGVARDAAIGVSLLIQALQVLPVTLLGVALAPQFVIRRRGRTAADTV